MEDRQVWLTAPLAYGETRLSALLLDPDTETAAIEMEATVHDPQHRDDEHVYHVGNLHVLFDWAEIFRLLDQSSQGQALAVLFDAQGRVIAASTRLRERGLLLSDALAPWRTEALRDAVVADNGHVLGFGEVLAGSASSQGYQRFHGFGWTVQVYQPTALAFAPIHRMAAAFFLLLVLTSAAAVALSLLIAGRIARPIVTDGADPQFHAKATSRRDDQNRQRRGGESTRSSWG